DRVRFKGNDRMWGGGQVTIDRSDFAARGDSMQLDQTSGFAVLVGKPRVQGKGPRPYALTGTRIELGLQGPEIRLVKALGDGVAQAESGHRPGLGPLLHASGESARLRGPVAQLLPWQGHRLHPEGRQGRPVHRHRTGQRRPAGAQAAGPGHDEKGRHDQSDGHYEKETRPMTAPISSPHLADLMAARDSSLPLAAAALARVADEQGHAPFSVLAI